MSYQKIRKPIVIGIAVLFHCLLIFHMLFSPVIIVLASNSGIINASFFSFILIFLLALFFGRAYCSWFCAGCGVQELIGFAVRKTSKKTKAVYIKYILFFVWIGAVVAGYIMKGFTKIDFFYGITDVSIGQKLIMTIGVVAIIVPLTVIFGRFASCKYICWQAPFMIFGRKIRDGLRLPGLRLVADSQSCKNCGLCTKKCPMDIDVMGKVQSGEIVDNECILCGNCIDACHLHVLSYRICRPAGK